MRYSSIGESLWSIWEGEELPVESDDSVTYFTETHVDVEHEIVRRALAAAIQHDGTADNLGAAYRAIESGIVTHGYYGNPVEEDFIVFCGEDGSTEDGYEMAFVLEGTWVEVVSNG